MRKLKITLHHKMSSGLPVIVSILLCFSGLLIFYFSDFINQPKMALYATLLWAGSISTWALYIFKNTKHEKKITSDKLTNFEKLLLLSIFVFAAFLRFYNINHYATFLDDWWWLDQARGIYNGIITTPFGFVGDQPSNLPAFLVFPIYVLTGKSYLAVRITGIILSLASLLIVFSLARSFFNKTVAFFAIFLMATSIWDIHVSKIPWINTTINPLLIFGSIYFFYKSLNSYSLKNTFFAGVFIGMSINLLYLATINIIGLVIFSVIALLFKKKKKNILLNLLMVGFSALLVCSPTFVKIFKYPQYSIGRHEKFINSNLHLTSDTSKM